MFEKITPEEAGISSDRVAEYISRLERRGATVHSILMMKGDKIFAEYAPKFKVPVYRGLPFGHHSKHLAIDFARTAVIKDGVIYFPASK